ncbi:MAG TPA: tetratricopeptide repeat protein [Vicinamibacterales bacterium]|nr:tetratricopeptide repeat protein [Vicinamibacterales bacterium]
MPIDRTQALKNAEKLLRQGKLDGAIAEYLRVVEDQPRDWNARNALGDLYVRAGQLDKATAQYLQIAEYLMHEGFYPRAAAQFKKILKIRPDDESLQRNLGEISAKQGLLADAKGYFSAIAKKRRARGDRAGADEMVIRLGSLDPADFDARVMAARTLAQNGDELGAATRYRSMHADLLEKGRNVEAMAALREAVRLNRDDVEGRTELAKAALAAGDLESVKTYLDRSIAGQDPSLLMTLLEMELRSGAMDSARGLIKELLVSDAALRTRIIDLAWTLAPTSSEAAFVCIDVLVEAELAAHDFMDAAAMLQEFATRVPGQIPSLLKLVEICVDGGLEAIMYETQAQLADAYLEAGQAAEARVIAEDLVAREPWEHAHIERFRRALVMLNVSDPDAVIAERLSGQGPFIATDPFMPPESFGEPEPALLRPHGAIEPPAPDPPGPEPERPPVEEPPAQKPPVTEPPAPTESPKPPARAAERDIPLRPRVGFVGTAPPKASAAAAPKDGGAGLDIDLTNVLEQLHEGVTGAADAPPSQNLESVFDDVRSEVAKQAGAKDASEHLALARTYIDMGMQEEAIAALRAAARVPIHRFESASLLGRLFLDRNDIPHAIEWFERAAEAPPPNEKEGRELLYDLGRSLDAAGETARALAVFLELHAEAGDYKDVAARVGRLSRVQTGG